MTQWHLRCKPFQEGIVGEFRTTFPDQASLILALVELTTAGMYAKYIVTHEDGPAIYPPAAQGETP